VVELIQDVAQEWRWRVKASNGKIIGASSEGYVHRSGALNNLRSLPEALNERLIRAASRGADKSDRGRCPLSFYTDRAGEWRWRITASNGRIIGASSEGYVQLDDAEDNLKQLVKTIEEQSSEMPD
jgi:uncharacterized protein YegP (UPF0339 family)